MATTAELATVVDACWELRLASSCFCLEEFLQVFALLIFEGCSSHGDEG